MERRDEPAVDPRPTAAAHAAALREVLGASKPLAWREQAALRVLISLSDVLAAASPDLRLALCVEPPTPSDRRVWNAALAGIAEHHLAASRTPLPAWLADGTEWRLRGLGVQLPTNLPLAPVRSGDRVIAAAAKRGVLIHASMLDSA